MPPGTSATARSCLREGLRLEGHPPPRRPSIRCESPMAVDAASEAGRRATRLTEQRRGASRPAGRLPVPRRAGTRHLRRQGEVDPQAGRQPLLQPGAVRDAGADRRDRPHRVARGLHRGRGAAHRADLHQAVQAALQHPAARRQVLPLHRDQPRRGLPARLLHARAPPAQPRLLRALLERQARARHARPARQDLPVPLLRGDGARPPLRLAVPGLLHQALRGALRRLRLPGGVPRGHRRRDGVPVGALQGDRARPRAQDVLPRRRAGLRAGDDRAQPAAVGARAARAPARRQRGRRHLRRGRRRRRRHGGQRAGLPGPRRRALATASPSTSTTRPSRARRWWPRSSSCSTTRARCRSRR